MILDGKWLYTKKKSCTLYLIGRIEDLIKIYNQVLQIVEF